MDKEERDKKAKEVTDWLNYYGYLDKLKKESQTKNKPLRDKRLIIYPLVIIFMSLIIAGTIFYGFYTDSFKSDISTNITMPEIPINNQYTFNPNNQNSYNFTPQNNYTIINKFYLNCTE